MLQFVLNSLCAFCLVQSASSLIYPTRFDNVTWDDEHWRLRTTYADQGHYEARASLANGYIGINVAALGPFFEVDEFVDGDDINGWPLFDRRQSFATVSAFWDEQAQTNGSNFPWLYQYGGESVISGIPHWSALYPECNGHVLNASTPLAQISDFSSTLDFRQALLSWTFKWAPAGCPSLSIGYDLFVNKLHVNQAAMRLNVTSQKDVNITIHDVLDGDCATRTTFFGKGFDAGTASIWSSVSPDGTPSRKAYVYTAVVADSSVAPGNWTESTQALFGKSFNESSISQCNTASLKAGKMSTIHKFVGIASSDAFTDPQKTAQTAAISGAKTGFSDMFSLHVEEWKSVVTPDLLDDYRFPNGTLSSNPNIIEQQILAVTNPFAILQNTIGDNTLIAAMNNTKIRENSIAVVGLTSDSYAGLVFWDVEVWMQPGLVVSFPDSMKQVANYRKDLLPQAIKNAQTAFTSSQNETYFSPNAALYPWTSSRSGNCTGTGPCFDYEYHINGDIALELENFYLTSGDVDTFRDDYFPIFDGVAQAYSNLLYLNHTSQKYNFRNATDPDEYANNVDNPGYTMILIQTILNRANEYRRQFNMTANETWTQQAAAIEIPESASAGIHLEYSTMNGSISVKQADVVLIYDLLDYQSDYALNDLEYYAGKQTLNGPGMTYAVFSIVSSAVSPSGCSNYVYDLWGSQPYARAPWFQYSEQLVDDYSLTGTHPAFPFLTAMGGANRVAIYGYLGLRLKQSSVNINPTLPPQISNLNYRTFYWQGHAINATSNSTHTTVARLHKSLPEANPMYGHNSSIPVTIGQKTEVHNLTFTSPLVFANRQPHLNKTVSGNIAQCLPVSSDSKYEPGQFPNGAVDGAVSTKWQPTLSSPASSLIVDLGEGGIVQIKGFEFDWAQTPPVSYSVAFSNSSSFEHKVTATHESNVTISNPYDAAKVADVVPYSSNTTTVDLKTPVIGGRYAMLTIKGNQGNHSTSAPAATVAEFAIIAAGMS